jgi:hypothetical protein
VLQEDNLIAKISSDRVGQEQMADGLTDAVGLDQGRLPALALGALV